MIRTAIVILLLPFGASADEVELFDGTVVEGKVLDLGDSIKVTRGGASVTYPKSSVKRVTFKKTREEIYEEKAGALKADDLAGHLELAQWCVEQKLRAAAQAEYKKVIAMDPDHAEARAVLGYTKYKDQWMTEDEIKQAQGLVKHKGKWMTPEERDLDVALENQKELDRKLILEVKKWLEKLPSSKEEVRTEAKAKLGAIADEYKAKSYLAALSSSSDRIRAFVVEELGRMAEKSAAKPLARRAIWDAREDIRASAVKSLIAINHPDTATYLTPYLEEESTRARIRVEEALSFFKDLRAAPPLLQILAGTLDTLRFIEQYEGQMAQILKRTLILKNGQRIILPANLKIAPEMFAPESKALLRSEKEACLSALRAVTGQDFGEDIAKWTEWLKKNKP